MFTIKAYSNDGTMFLIEASEVRINPNRSMVEYMTPLIPENLQCLLVDSNSRNFLAAYIENQSGKTIETLRAAT